MKNISFCIAMSLFLISCSEKPEDKTQTVNREGAIETSLDIQHLNSIQDVLVTTHKVWKNASLLKTIEYRDTVAALGKYVSEAEDGVGNKKMVNVQRDYEFYITVK